MGHKPHRPVLSHVEIVTINDDKRKVNTMKQDLGTQFFATNAFETNKFLYSFTFGMQFNLKNSHRIMRFKKPVSDCSQFDLVLTSLWHGLQKDTDIMQVRMLGPLLWYQVLPCFEEIMKA